MLCQEYLSKSKECGKLPCCPKYFRLGRHGEAYTSSLHNEVIQDCSGRLRTYVVRRTFNIWYSSLIIDLRYHVRDSNDLVHKGLMPLQILIQKTVKTVNNQVLTAGKECSVDIVQSVKVTFGGNLIMKRVASQCFYFFLCSLQQGGVPIQIFLNTQLLLLFGLQDAQK